MTEIKESLAKAKAKSASVRASISNYPTEQQHWSLQSAAVAHAAILRRDIERRDASFADRERKYEETIEDLETRVVEYRQKLALGLKATGLGQDTMDHVYGLQRDVMENLRVFEDRSASIMQERERDLSRACRARMSDWTKELAELMRRQDLGVKSWKQRTDLLEKERQWARNLCSQLEERNDALSRENKELVANFKKGEGNRKALVSQLAQVKKDTGRCHQVASHLDDQIAVLKRESPPDSHEESLRRRATPDANSDSRVKCLEEVGHLERLLEHQQNKLMTMRLACVADAEESVALQRLIRQRILDISDVLRALQGDSSTQTPTIQGKPSNDPPRESWKDETTIAKLTWENRILTILYEKTFPPRRK